MKNDPMKQGYLYILTNKPQGVMYTGVTSNLQKRIEQHKEKTYKGFTSKYNLMRLVYFEVYQDIKEAIIREKQIKNWKRAWKIELIEKQNLNWEDLSNKL